MSVAAPAPMKCSCRLLNKDNGGFTTWYSVQNASTDEATVNVSYSDGTSAGRADDSARRRRGLLPER